MAFPGKSSCSPHPQHASKRWVSYHTFDGQIGSCLHLSTLTSRAFLFQPSDLRASISGISIIQSHFENSGWKRFPGLVLRENASNVTVCRVRPSLGNQITITHNHPRVWLHMHVLIAVFRGRMRVFFLTSTLKFSYCEKSIACAVLCSWLKRVYLSVWDFEHIASLLLTPIGRRTTWPQASTG